MLIVSFLAQLTTHRILKIQTATKHPLVPLIGHRERVLQQSTVIMRIMELPGFGPFVLVGIRMNMMTRPAPRPVMAKSIRASAMFYTGIQKYFDRTTE
jgi:hypothetical protein